MKYILCLTEKLKTLTSPSVGKAVEWEKTLLARSKISATTLWKYLALSPNPEYLYDQLYSWIHMQEKALHMSLLPSDTGKWKPLLWTPNLTSLLWSDFLSFSKAPPMPGWALVPGAIAPWPQTRPCGPQSLFPSFGVLWLSALWWERRSAELWTHAYGILLELSAGSCFQKGNLIRSAAPGRKGILCQPMDYSHPPARLFYPWGFPGKILESVAMPSSRRSFWPRDRTQVSYVSCIDRWVLYC